MSLIDKALTLRATIERLATNLDDSEAVESIELFPYWKVDTAYIAGDRVRFDGILYKVLQPHTSQITWTPDVTPALYTKVLIPEPSVIPVWEQPSAENGYMIGDRVHYPTAEDDIYESTIDNNVWSPIAYPAGWKKI